ncbi:MAG: pentapeptide repeat-containing protein [Eubacteriales bacterium]
MSDNNLVTTPVRDIGYLRSDCKNCFGLCCVALYCSASEGFPADKDVGEPCIYLQPDFRCRVHESLKERKLKGCLAFDCFGAGQKVSQISFDNKSWLQYPDISNQMFDMFLYMRQLHELLWYLTLALMYLQVYSIREVSEAKLKETEHLSFLSPEFLANVDITAYSSEIYNHLFTVSKIVRSTVRHRQNSYTAHSKKLGPRTDLFAVDLRRTDLKGIDLRGSCLIASDLRGSELDGTDFIGADFRDADIRDADLSKSLFLTQSQINSAKGNHRTKLPPAIIRPLHWNI